MSDGMIVAISLGIVAFLIFIVVLVARKSPDSGKFDEMQLIVRARGYKIGFFVTLIGLIILMVLTDLSSTENPVINPALGMAIVMMLGIVAFALYCIWKDAFFHVKQKGNYYIVICIIVIITNLIGALPLITSQEGADAFHNGINIVMAISFAIILINLLLKKYAARNEVDE